MVLSIFMPLLHDMLFVWMRYYFFHYLYHGSAWSPQLRAPRTRTHFALSEALQLIQTKQKLEKKEKQSDLPKNCLLSTPPSTHAWPHFFLKRWKRAYREIYCTSKESKFVLQWGNRERIKIVRNILQHADIVEGSLKLCRSKRKRTIMAKTF